MSPDLLRRLAAVGTTSLCDADPTLRVVIGLSPLSPAPRMVGVARTVESGGDLLPVLRALESAEQGDVLVVDAAGSPLAVAGELFATQAEHSGVRGLVVDGCVRDVATLRSLAMPVYARAPSRPPARPARGVASR